MNRIVTKRFKYEFTQAAFVVIPYFYGAFHQIMEDLCLVILISDGYYFSTCGNPIGPLGPSYQHCKDAYKDTNVSVEIGDSSKTETDAHSFGYVTGIQRWTVPKTGLYTWADL